MRHKTRQILLILGVFVVVGISIWGISILNKTHKIDTSSYPTAEEITEEKTKNETKNPVSQDYIDNAPYMKESSYKGGKEIPESVFQIPFQKTDNYTPNTELEKTVSEKRLEAYKETAENFVQTVYSHSYHDYVSDIDTISEDYKNLTDSLVYVVDDDVYEPNIFLEQCADSIVDSKSAVDVNFVTDTGLIYEDFGRDYIRGVIEFKVNESDNINAIEAMFHVKGIETGKKYRRIVEFQINRPLSNGNLSVVEISFLNP